MPNVLGRIIHAQKEHVQMVNIFFINKKGLNYVQVTWIWKQIKLCIVN